MIDWLNVWLGLFFLVSGVILIGVAIRNWLYSKVATPFLIAGVLTFAMALYVLLGLFSFNPELHECTEWEQDAYCYNETYQSVTSSLQVVTGGVSVGCSGNLKMRFVGYGECVSFREKKQVVSDD